MINYVLSVNLKEAVTLEELGQMKLQHGADRAGAFAEAERLSKNDKIESITLNATEEWCEGVWRKGERRLR